MTPSRFQRWRSRNPDLIEMVSSWLTNQTQLWWATFIPSQSLSSKKKYSACPCSLMSNRTACWGVWLSRIRKSLSSRSLSFCRCPTWSQIISQPNMLRRLHPSTQPKLRTKRTRATTIQTLCPSMSKRTSLRDTMEGIERNKSLVTLSRKASLLETRAIKSSTAVMSRWCQILMTKTRPPSETYLHWSRMLHLDATATMRLSPATLKRWLVTLCPKEALLSVICHRTWTCPGHRSIRDSMIWLSHLSMALAILTRWSVEACISHRTSLE